jgi:hypothetical protein
VLDGGGGRDAKPEGGTLSAIVNRLRDFSEAVVFDQGDKWMNNSSFAMNRSAQDGSV